MPVQPPSYEVPAFNPGGSTDLSAAMQEWTQSFGKQYREGQEALQRIPAIYTTFSNESTGNPKANYITLAVPFQGGEQAIAIGYFDFSVSTGGVLTSGLGNSYTESARGKLKVVYPSGTTESFGAAQEANLRITVAGEGSSAGVSRTTVSVRSNVSFTWPITARFQNGGEHKFVLRTTGQGTINSGQLTILQV